MRAAPLTLPEDRRALARTVLEALPQWFGIEAAREEYIAQAAGLPFWAALEGDEPLGFAALRPQTAAAAELYVLGVLPGAHRRGAGRALVAACAGWCRERGRGYLTVKTLAESHPDPGYAKTRAFYAAAGFVPLEVFPDLWGPQNPCLLMALPIERTVRL